MQRVIDHHAVLATRADLILDEDGSCRRVLHVDTRLVLTPGADDFSQRAVSDFIELVNTYRTQHRISKVVLHEVD